MTELCKSCARQNFCGNNITKYYCTGYMPYVETRWEADDIKVPPFTDGQKKLIEMTEKLANGKQICDVAGADITTNFERITKSPAALAEWLNEHSDYCKEIQNWQCTDCPYSDKYCTRENQWLDWLMQESDTE